MKPIQGYPNYSVTDDGRIWSHNKQGFLLPALNKNVKYLMVSLWKYNKGTTFYVHRLVAAHWIPNPNNYPEVNHKDLDRCNNHVSNLEWVTRRGNYVHAIENQARTYTNKLTKQEFIKLLEKVIAGASYTSLCEAGVPYKVPYLSVKLRNIAKELGLEEELDISLAQQRLERALRNLP